jgi:thioesterase domain-containing protein
VEEMASRYLESLRVIQPKGPYFLGGSSFGGTIAFEMAQQLITQGETVALLALLDSPGGQQLDVHLQGDAEVFAYLLNVGTNLSVSSQELQSLPPSQRLGYFLKNGGMARELLPDMDIEQIQPFMDVFQRNIEALKYYNPRPYPGRILFFRASDRDSITPAHPERAWLDLATDGVEIHEVPGNHITMNFSPHVQAIANQLTIALQDARSL